jgi:hypothetical protein
MALQKNFTLNNGLEVPNAYIKIETLSSTKESATARIGVYVSKEKIQNGSVYEQYRIFTPDFTDEADNLWKQCYKYLKSLPEFAGAEDILEDGQQA